MNFKVLQFFKKVFLGYVYFLGPLLLISCIFSIVFAEVQISDEAKKEIGKHNYSFLLHGGYSGQSGTKVNFFQRKYVLVKLNPFSSITITGTIRNNQPPKFETRVGGLKQFIIFFILGIALTWWLWAKLIHNKIKNENANDVGADAQKGARPF